MQHIHLINLAATIAVEDTESIQALVELQTLETGILVFFVVVVLCYFVYKFLRMFF